MKYRAIEKMRCHRRVDRKNYAVKWACELTDRIGNEFEVEVNEVQLNGQLWGTPGGALLDNQGVVVLDVMGSTYEVVEMGSRKILRVEEIRMKGR